MSDDVHPSEPSPLQFDKAELAGGAPAAVTCSLCQATVQASYFEINGAVACDGCRQQKEQETTGGSRVGRFSRAGALGTLAAAVGAGIYYGVAALTGYEFGLIAIVVGLLVGGAVRVGSHGRGGWLYQALAMLLTYLSIVGMHVPEVAKLYRDTLATGDGSNLYAVVILVVVAGILLAAPFLGGLENIMGLIIIGIGLYEAWKINRRQPVVVTGPYRVGQAPAVPPVPEAG